MSNCSFCGKPLLLGKTFCPICGRITTTANMGTAVGELSDDALVDVLDVEAAVVKRILTNVGPCDQAFGGGFVHSTTTLFGGSAGAGKTTLNLQLSFAFSKLAQKPAYMISAEQEKGEIKFTIDRLGLPFEPGQLKVLKTFGSGGTVSEKTLNDNPPSFMVLDSLTALCGLKEKDKQLDICKLYKRYALKYKAPVFIINQMMKEGDYAGLYALQHEVDTLATLEGIGDDRKRDRIYAETGVEGDLRELIVWKNRYGATGVPFILVMTPHGLVSLPKGAEEKADAPRTRTGNRLLDMVLELNDLEAEAKDTAFEYRERVKDMRERVAKIATKEEAALLQQAREKAAELARTRRPKPPPEPPRQRSKKVSVPESIEVNGQKLVKRPKTSDRAKAIEGEALKRKRPPMPKDPPKKKATKSKSKKTKPKKKAA